nr:uncharacterized protein LOC112032420 [Quercus suber]
MDPWTWQQRVGLGRVGRFGQVTRIEAQIKPKSPNKRVQKPSPGENRTSTSTNASSSLINGAPPRRYSRYHFVLSRRPHTQVLRPCIQLVPFTKVSSNMTLTQPYVLSLLNGISG